MHAAAQALLNRYTAEVGSLHDEMLENAAEPMVILLVDTATSPGDSLFAVFQARGVPMRPKDNVAVLGIPKTLACDLMKVGGFEPMSAALSNGTIPLDGPIVFVITENNVSLASVPEDFPDDGHESRDLMTHTIYDHPADYPNHYVVRSAIIRAGAILNQPHAALFEDLDRARAWIQQEHPGVVKVQAEGQDTNAGILEVWM